MRVGVQRGAPLYAVSGLQTPRVLDQWTLGLREVSGQNH